MVQRSSLWRQMIILAILIGIYMTDVTTGHRSWPPKAGSGGYGDSEDDGGYNPDDENGGRGDDSKGDGSKDNNDQSGYNDNRNEKLISSDTPRQSSQPSRCGASDTYSRGQQPHRSWPNNDRNQYANNEFDNSANNDNGNGYPRSQNNNNGQSDYVSYPRNQNRNGKSSDYGNDNYSGNRNPNNNFNDYGNNNNYGASRNGNSGNDGVKYFQLFSAYQPSQLLEPYSGYLRLAEALDPAPQRQLWYEDKVSGFIRNAEGGQTFLNSESSASLRMTKDYENPSSQWTFDNGRIHNAIQINGVPAEILKVRYINGKAPIVTTEKVKNYTGHTSPRDPSMWSKKYQPVGEQSRRGSDD